MAGHATRARAGDPAETVTCLEMPCCLRRRSSGTSRSRVGPPLLVVHQRGDRSDRDRRRRARARPPAGTRPRPWSASRPPSRPTSSATATTSWRPGCGGVRTGESKWRYAPMAARWATTAGTATSSPAALGRHELVIEAWTDRFATWRHDVQVKQGAGQDIRVELEEGALLLERRAADVSSADRKVAGEGGGDAAHRALRPERGPRARRLAGGAGDGARSARSHRPPTSSPLWVDRERAVFSAWYELFPRSEGGLRAPPKRLPRRRRRWASTSSTCRPSTPSAPATARAGTTPSTPAPTIPGARGPSGAPRAATPPSTPTSAPSTTSTTSWRRPTRSAWRSPSTTPSSARPTTLGHGPPEWFHHRPDGSINYAENPPKKYQDIYPINFWPAEERRPRGAVGRVPGHPRLLDRPRRAHLPGRQPPHQAVGLLGVDHRRGAARPPRRALPRRGLHPAQGDGEPGRGRLHPELHVLHLAHDQVGAARVPRGARPGAEGRLLAAQLLAEHARHPGRAAARRGPAAFRLRLVLAATLVPATASTAATSWARTSRRRRPTRSTSTPRSTRSSTATGTTPHRWPRSSPSSTTSAAATRRCASCATSRFHGSFNDAHAGLLEAQRRRIRPRARRRQPRPGGGPRGHRLLDLDALGMPANRPFDAPDELTGATYVWQGPSPTSASTRTPRPTSSACASTSTPAPSTSDPPAWVST